MKHNVSMLQELVKFFICKMKLFFFGAASSYNEIFINSHVNHLFSLSIASLCFMEQGGGSLSSVTYLESMLFLELEFFMLIASVMISIL